MRSTHRHRRQQRQGNSRNVRRPRAITQEKIETPPDQMGGGHHQADCPASQRPFDEIRGRALVANANSSGDRRILILAVSIFHA